MDINDRQTPVSEKLQALSVARQESIMQSESIDRKEWVYTGDYRNESVHCRNHASMNGQIVPKDKSFTLVGLDGIAYYPMHPHDLILPPTERDDCKCIHQGVIKDEVLGLSRRDLFKRQSEIAYEDDVEWERELDAQNRAKAGINENDGGS